MRIAVSSQNFRTVTPHAGRARRFLVFEVEEGGEVNEVDRLDLAKEFAMHDWQGGGAHPLDAVDVLIAGSFGEGFGQRMAARGIVAVRTDQTDPLEAVKHYLAAKHEVSGPSCDHGHRHQHQHAHAHGCCCHREEGV